MTERKEVISHCLAFQNVYEDYPFRDTDWCVVRHKDNRKVFAWIFEREGYIWVNVKCSPEWAEVWRQTYPSVLPAYHLNKKHWNSIILDGTVPDEEICRMIGDSYDLTGERRKENG